MVLTNHVQGLFAALEDRKKDVRNAAATARALPGADTAAGEPLLARVEALLTDATAAEGAYGAIAPAGCGAGIRQRGDVAGRGEPSHCHSGGAASPASPPQAACASRLR